MESTTPVIPFARDLNGRGVGWDLARHPHLLLVGGAGIGKTHAASILAESAAAGGAQVRIVDDVSGGAGYRAAPGSVIADPAAAMLLFSTLNRTLEQRQRQLVDAKARTIADLPAGARPQRVVTVLEGITGLIAEETCTRKERDIILYVAGRIARHGRSAGIHLITVAQSLHGAHISAHPGVAAIASGSSPIAFGRISPLQHRIVFGHSPAAVLPAGSPKGRAVFGPQGCVPRVIQVVPETPMPPTRINAQA